MPKRAPIPPLDYLNSPTPGAPSNRARTPTPSQPHSPQDASPPQGERTNSTTTLAEGEDTDMSDPDVHLGGVRDSMHAPRRDITPTPQAPQRLPTPTTQTPRQRAPPDTPGLILSLNTIAETSPYMANFTSTAQNDSLFTPPPADDFPASHRGMAGEFLVGLNPETIDAWCDLPDPKFFLRVFGYD